MTANEQLVKRSNSLTPRALQRQAAIFRGSGGASEDNRCAGFAPAFLDTETGKIYPSRFADGRRAPLHVLDGLPDELVVARQESGTVSAVKQSVVAGFSRRGRFFTREQAARLSRKHRKASCTYAESLRSAALDGD